MRELLLILLAVGAASLLLSLLSLATWVATGVIFNMAAEANKQDLDDLDLD